MIGIRGRSMLLKVTCSLVILSVLKEGVDSSCMTPLENIAEYEGALNKLVYFPADSNDARFEYVATTEEHMLTTIVNKDDTVSFDCAADYEYNYTSGLMIKKATATVEPGHQRSTAGYYFVSCNNQDYFSFQFLVVRQGPTCSCTSVDSSSVQLTCSSIYAVTSTCKIDAIFTLYVDGIEFAAERPDSTRDDSNKVYISTATFTGPFSDSSNYQCGQTFSAPLNCPYPELAKNAPNFNQRCSFACPLATTDDTTTTTQPPTTTTPQPLTTTQPSTSTSKSLTQTQFSTTISRSPPPDEDCNRTRECQPESGTDNSGIYIQRVVKAQLYTRSDKCCPNNQACGVVVTLQNGSRYLIHDPVCNDNKLKMSVVVASCMSSDWKLISQKTIIMSSVGDFVQAGNLPRICLIIIPCLESCNVMMGRP